MVKVLFVCLGNICRSPLAEGIFNHLIEQKGLQDKISSDSAGTSGWHIGEPPDMRSEAIANKHGISLDHYGRQVEHKDFEEFDYIIAMDKSNLQHLKDMKGSDDPLDEHLAMIRKFDGIGTNQDVPDPYFGGPEGFQHVYEMLKRSCKNLLNHIVEKHQISAN